ncbi:MAG: LrgB family protein [Rhodospirillales bacterium]|nr:LrgB family protein [Rhodospirillales bacterium]
MSTAGQGIWIYLAATPLTWLALTLVAYEAGVVINHAAGRRALVNPVLIAVILIALLLTATGTSYQRYFDGAQFVHFLLGPATVALAVPLWRQFHHVRRSWAAVIVALFAGSFTAVTSAIGIAWLLGATPEMLASLAPKSVTTPIAMAVSAELNGLPTVTAVAVIITGVVGAVLGTTVLRVLRVHDPHAVGFALGLTCHGLGTARAFQISDEAGGFAGLAMGLNGFVTAVVLPLAWVLFS